MHIPAIVEKEIETLRPFTLVKFSGPRQVSDQVCAFTLGKSWPETCLRPVSDLPSAFTLVKFSGPRQVSDQFFAFILGKSWSQSRLDWTYSGVELRPV